MSSEAFKPLLSDGAVNFFFWIFAILSVAGLIWFSLYLGNSKEKTIKTTSYGLIIVSIFTAITMLMAFLKFNVFID